MNDSPLLEIRGLSKTYSGENIAANEVLVGLSLTVHQNDFLCILGPSGCGKSTLLRCIAGFEEYTGTILLQGQPAGKPGGDRIMVFQDFNQLFPWKTVIQNVCYPLRLRGVRDKTALAEVAETYLGKVGLWDYRDYYPHQLSGGMKQRAAIARALTLKPSLILMDEPFASLDAITRRNLQNELMVATGGEDTTVLFVTHNIQEALILGTRTMILGQGGAIVVDEPNSLQKPVRPSSPGYAEIWDRYSQALQQPGPRTHL